jgi:hypothetical protein
MEPVQLFDFLFGTAKVKSFPHQRIIQKIRLEISLIAKTINHKNSALTDTMKNLP